MGSCEKGDIYDVDVGQNLELEYASMEPSRQGKLSILNRQESSFFALTFGMLYLFYFESIFGTVGVGLFLTKDEKKFLLQIPWETTFLKAWNDKLILFSSSKLEKINLIDLIITLENDIIFMFLSSTEHPSKRMLVQWEEKNNYNQIS